MNGMAGWRIRERASWADRFRLAAYLAANPDARITPGEFGEWYCDLPSGRAHAPTLGGLLRKLDEPPPDPDTG